MTNEERLTEIVRGRLAEFFQGIRVDTTMELEQEGLAFPINAKEIVAGEFIYCGLQFAMSATDNSKDAYDLIARKLASARSQLEKDLG